MTRATGVRHIYLIYCLKLFNIIYIFVQLEATVPLQEVGGVDEESVIMSTAKVYHIKMDSSELDECGEEKTKCWAGKWRGFLEVW